MNRHDKATTLAGAVLVASTAATVAAISYGFALAGEPSAVWLWCELWEAC